MRTRQKQSIVEKFKAGNSIPWLAFVYVCKREGTVGRWQQALIEEVLRDYMNGKLKN